MRHVRLFFGRLYFWGSFLTRFHRTFVSKMELKVRILDIQILFVSHTST